ncbi:hypothetical protein COLO4_19636 [Corchorus olitorius]|uniref:Uncharacterized protein n=1 Tax=Corchorus olitorius TaxID=93759 RepID=A0A1R3J486_9ROSI|nr:hypothetical protein COLO4_19636 [Corchorus olitorius]
MAQLNGRVLSSGSCRAYFFVNLLLLSKLLRSESVLACASFLLAWGISFSPLYAFALLGLCSTFALSNSNLEFTRQRHSTSQQGDRLRKGEDKKDRTSSLRRRSSVSSNSLGAMFSTLRKVSPFLGFLCHPWILRFHPYRKYRSFDQRIRAWTKSDDGWEVNYLPGGYLNPGPFVATISVVESDYVLPALADCLGLAQLVGFAACRFRCRACLLFGIPLSQVMGHLISSRGLIGGEIPFYPSGNGEEAHHGIWERDSTSKESRCYKELVPELIRFNSPLLPPRESTQKEFSQLGL